MVFTEKPADLTAGKSYLRAVGVLTALTVRVGYRLSLSRLTVRRSLKNRLALASSSPIRFSASGVVSRRHGHYTAKTSRENLDFRKP